MLKQEEYNQLSDELKNRAVIVNDDVIICPEEIMKDQSELGENLSADDFNMKNAKPGQFLSSSDLVRGILHDKVYSISHKPFVSNEELGEKLMDGIFLQGFSKGLKELERNGITIPLDKTLEYMQNDSKFREGFDSAFSKDAGKFYMSAFEIGVSKMVERKNIRQIDVPGLKRFNEICLEHTFNKVFESLKSPDADRDQVIELGKSTGKIAKNTGIKPEAALDSFLKKHPGAAPEGIVSAIKEGFKQINAQAQHISEVQQDGPAKDAPKQQSSKVPGM